MANLSECKNKKYWNAVQQRDKGFDGVIYYAVKTTGIYCKPSCPSRRPIFDSVIFFASSGEAEKAGFRPCKRCKPELDHFLQTSAFLFSRAQKILEEHPESNPSVKEWAVLSEVSVARLRGVTKEMTGVTPREYLFNRKVVSFKKNVQSGENVTSALYSAGFGSSSRLYEKAADQLGMTPGKYKKGGQGEVIKFTVMDTPFGHLLVAATKVGLCSVKFGETDRELKEDLQKEFPMAEFVVDGDGLERWVELLRQYFSGKALLQGIPLDVRSTMFRQKVWEALRNIPIGETRSYSEVARTIGRPTAVRAVASACAANPVALVTPCHRVIHSDGNISGYRWGTDRKKALLEMEQKNVP